MAPARIVLTDWLLGFYLMPRYNATPNFMDFHLAILSVTPWSSAPVRSNYLHNAKMFKRQVASTVP